MLEIAIALAVIAFALVAIIGVLPTGLNVQKDNQEDTIISQDSSYFVNAIQNGAEGMDDLPRYVQDITIRSNSMDLVRFDVAQANLTGYDIIGLLSVSSTTNTANGGANPATGEDYPRVAVATVRAISGIAAEKGANTADVAFKYQLRVQNRPFRAIDLNLSSNEVLQLERNLHELRLEFRWPVLPDGKTGAGRRVVRTLVSARLIETNSANAAVNSANFPLYFFRTR